MPTVEMFVRYVRKNFSFALVCIGQKIEHSESWFASMDAYSTDVHNYVHELLQCAMFIHLLFTLNVSSHFVAIS